MVAVKPVGRAAAARKYDLLTAMGTHALSSGKAEARRCLRLMTLITARYNWARDELAVGQREIARLWSCDTRTVKREMAALRASGWLVLKRQGARGRVAEYGIDIDCILSTTRSAWDAIGPDFVLRMEAQSGGGGEGPTIVPFPSTAVVPPPEIADATEWALARALLHQEDPGSYGAWVSKLEREGRSGGRLTLRAPSRFHATYVITHLTERLLAACQAVDAGVSDVSVIT